MKGENGEIIIIKELRQEIFRKHKEKIQGRNKWKLIMVKGYCKITAAEHIQKAAYPEWQSSSIREREWNSWGICIDEIGKHSDES